MSSGLLPGNRTWRCEVEDVRHYNKYFMTLTSERGDVETSRARTFFLSSGVSQWNQSLSALNLVPISVNGKVTQRQQTRTDLTIRFGQSAQTDQDSKRQNRSDAVLCGDAYDHSQDETFCGHSIEPSRGSSKHVVQEEDTTSETFKDTKTESEIHATTRKTLQITETKNTNRTQITSRSQTSRD